MSQARFKVIAEWILKPFVIAAFVVMLGGLIVGTLSQQYSFAALRAAIHRQLSPVYERGLPGSLLTELRAGGFTLFIRHGRRDGLTYRDLPSATAIDRAFLIDPALIPPDWRWGLCLNEVGRVESRLLGHFLKKAGIPVGEVLASPLCRARETAELSIGRVDRLEPSLVFESVLANAAERSVRAVGLKRLLERAPAPGKNRVLFSHSSVLEAYGYEGLRLEEAGMVVFEHTGNGLKIRAVVPLREMLNALPANLATQG